MYGKAGDFEIACTDQNGNALEPILLLIPNSDLNLLSIRLLCERGVSFSFKKKSQGGSKLTYNDNSYPIIEKNGLYLIPLDEFLVPEELAEFAGHASDADVRRLNGEAYLSTGT